jgi:uncharacterized protein YecT (DUF1311 family)
MLKISLATIGTITLFGLGIAGGTIATATPDVTGVEVAQRPNCNNPQTQSEMNACAGIAYRNADRRLNQVYQQLTPKLSASRRQQLVTAQQAWIRYRDASCNFERSEVEGGSMAPMIQGNCLARLTEQRTKDLQQYLESTDR